MPSIDSKVEALEIAFVELAKFLGRQQVIPVIQLATVLKDTARTSKSSEETKEALNHLSQMLQT